MVNLRLLTASFGVCEGQWHGGASSFPNNLTH